MQQLNLDFSTDISVEQLQQELEGLELYTAQAELELKRLYKLKLEKNKKLQLICPHKNTLLGVSVIPGDYYNRKETIINHRCKVCGKIVHTQSRLGNYA